MSKIPNRLPWALVAALLLTACSRDNDSSNPGLDTLLKVPENTPAELDVDKARADVDELAKVLREGHHRLSEVIGAHKVAGKALVTVSNAGNVVEELTTTIQIEVDKDFHFDARLNNSKSYGRHAIWDGESLYLRPGQGKFNKRLPNDEAEVASTQDAFFAHPWAQFELVLGHVDIAASTDELLDKRAVVTIDLALASKPRKLDEETLEHRKWRSGITVSKLSGKVHLDKETGIPLALDLSSSVGFTRDGKNFVMKLEVEQTISDIGHALTVAVPPADQIMSAPKRLPELDERELLLDGIAPPAKRGEPARGSK
jgi:hypothetical protein